MLTNIVNDTDTNYYDNLMEDLPRHSQNYLKVNVLDEQIPEHYSTIIIPGSCFKNKGSGIIKTLVNKIFGDSEKILYARLGLDEAAVNAWKHGNKKNPDKIITIRYNTADDIFTAYIQDQGNGFQPKKIPNPIGSIEENGRGVFMMQSYAKVTYNSTGNRIKLEIIK